MTIYKYKNTSAKLRRTSEYFYSKNILFMTSWIIFWAPDLFMLCSLLVLRVYGIIVSSNLQKQETAFFWSQSTKNNKYGYSQKKTYCGYR